MAKAWKYVGKDEEEEDSKLANMHVDRERFKIFPKIGYAENAVNNANNYLENANKLSPVHKRISSLSTLYNRAQTDQIRKVSFSQSW